ncbi:hypothetical protein TRIUR3_20920 [Triticum urartu]|uniref:CCHC-type domain-containing protein n=1 Tax=Triticum urartu TaxID=4572 RepID=M8A7G9_TRIUA|nr:hypothetical protein TRIUR3_20920 [Triticum urartu]
MPLCLPRLGGRPRLGPAAPEDSALGWQHVRSRKEKRNPQPPVLGDPRQGRQGRRAPPSDPMALKQHLAFKARLRGKCFRCLSKRHRLADCREPLRCIRCKGIGHFARTCSASLPQPPPPPARKPSEPSALPPPAGIFRLLLRRPGWLCPPFCGTLFGPTREELDELHGLTHDEQEAQGGGGVCLQ